MAQVARQAEVSMATLYRNYSGRRALLQGLYGQEVDDLCRAAQLSCGPPGEALQVWLQRFVVFHENKHPIAVELLRHVDRADPVFGSSRDRVLTAGRPLLLAAQQAQVARTDLTIEQILDLVLAVITISTDHSYIKPILRAALDGLRSQAPPDLT